MVDNASELINFENDIDRISFHLLSVEALLRKKDQTNLNYSQIQNRLQMLDILHQYALKKEFPINTYHKERTPYFIDIYGTHCAVGYLVMRSGFGHISRAISASQNYAYVKEIQSEELVKWVHDFGFKLDELALIQPTYQSQIPYSQLGTGVNGRVTTLDNGTYGTLCIGGDFDQIGDLPCKHVAVYQNNQLSCLGEGLDGIVNDIEKSGSKIYVAGKFSFQSTSYPLAVFENNSWVFISFPGYDDAEGTAISDGALSVAITDQQRHGAIFTRSTNWNLLMKFNGRVNAINHSYNEYLKTYAGIFDSAFVQSAQYNPISGLMQTFQDTIETKNVIQYYETNVTNNGITQEIPIWIPYVHQLPDTIYTICKVGQNLYLGGSANTNNINSEGIIMSRILNEVVQPLLYNPNPYGLVPYMSINDMSIAYNSTKILIGGHLWYLGNDMMYQSQNLHYYDPLTNWISDAGYANEDVYAVAMGSTQNFIGGDFTTWNTTTSSVNHIAQTEHHLGLNENLGEFDFSISPNPASEEIYLQGLLIEDKDIQILDITSALTPVFFENGKANISVLNKGVYFIQIIKEGKILGTKRLVKT